MNVIQGYRNLIKTPQRAVAALGNFDGVHRGHQKILSLIRNRASELQGTSVVYTFHPHPLSILMPDRQLLQITTLDEKLQLMEHCGIDLVICEPFTVEFSRVTAETFVREILHKSIGVKEVYVGEDYAFGSKRQGNIYYLKKMGGILDFRVKIVDSISVDDIIVKSSKIRELIQQGDMRTVHRLLGRDYSIRGTVIRGKQRGADLGFPTANIKPQKLLHPGVGVYATWVEYENNMYRGAMNIGYNPTFSGQTLSLEVHILDFDQDIYGRDVEVFFVEKIRGEKTFSAPEDLVAQMHKDISKIKEMLGGIPQEAHGQHR